VTRGEVMAMTDDGIDDALAQTAEQIGIDFVPSAPPVALPSGVLSVCSIDRIWLMKPARMHVESFQGRRS
jgi:hypothetical protein